MQLSGPRSTANPSFDRWSIAFFALGLCALFVALPRAHPGFAVNDALRTSAVLIAYLAIAAGAAMRMLGFR